MGENLMQIEEHHRQMLEKVDESNVHHNKLIDVQRQLKEKESRKGWLKRRIELHEEMEKFWSGQVDQSTKLDDEESKRSIEIIRDQLLQAFKERDERKDDDRGQEPTDKGPSRDRKKERPRRSKGGEKGVKEDKPPEGDQPPPAEEEVVDGKEAPPAEPPQRPEKEVSKEVEPVKDGEIDQGSGPGEKGGDA
jgi:hypothetical protein